MSERYHVPATPRYQVRPYRLADGTSSRYEAVLLDGEVLDVYEDWRLAEAYARYMNGRKDLRWFGAQGGAPGCRRYH